MDEIPSYKRQQRTSVLQALDLLRTNEVTLSLGRVDGWIDMTVSRVWVVWHVKTRPVSWSSFGPPQPTTLSSFPDVRIEAFVAICGIQSESHGYEVWFCYIYSGSKPDSMEQKDWL